MTDDNLIYNTEPPYNKDPVTNKLLENGWNTNKPPHHSHGWAWIIVVVIIILIGIFIYYRFIWEDRNNFGTYADPVYGPCTGTNNCTDLGQRVVVKTCIPNPITGRGCLVPSGLPMEGKQSYDDLISVEDCNLVCVASRWKEITPDDSICIVTSNNNPDQCLAQSTTGITTRTFQCVTHDSTGTNQCTHNQLDTYAGPTGITSEKPILTTYQVGETVTVESSCQNWPNPICGEWEVYFPPVGGDPLPPSPPQPVNPNTQNITSCIFNINLIPVENCIVESNPDKRDIRWENLREGYDTTNLSCIYKDENNQLVGITPTDNQPPTKFCEILQPPECSDKGIIPEQIRIGNIPVEPGQELPDPILCPGTLNNRQNPVCYQPCRSFQTNIPDIGDGSFNSILGNIFSIRWPNQGYLSLMHIPSSQPNVGIFVDTQSSNTDILFPVESMEIPYTYTRAGCTQEQLEFDTSLLLMLGPRRYENSVLYSQIMGLIGGSYLGWMSYDNGKFIWRQAYNQYQGPGITSDNSLATLFQVTSNSIGSQFPDNFSDNFIQGTLGSFNISIKGPAGQTISVFSAPPPTSQNNILNNTFTLDDVTAVIYDPNILNSDTRASRSAVNCNLLHIRS